MQSSIRRKDVRNRWPGPVLAWIVVGCGSSAVSWGSGCKIELLVVVEVVAAEFLLLVPLPVLVEVAVGDDGAQVQDGFGARGGPPRAGDVHPVLYEESCCAFDDPGGDLPAVGQGGGVVQVRGLGGQVGDGFVG